MQTGGKVHQIVVKVFFLQILLQRTSQLNQSLKVMVSCNLQIFGVLGKYLLNFCLHGVAFVFWKRLSEWVQFDPVACRKKFALGHGVGNRYRSGQKYEIPMLLVDIDGIWNSKVSLLMLHVDVRMFWSCCAHRRASMLSQY
jgi:hypothetical protein